MATSFFFYDLETSGFNPRTARIMQFAGQRTDLNLKPIGEPVNVLIKLTPEVLPDPDAVLVTGITPQQTLTDGITEAEFLKFFYGKVVKPDTVFVGYNSICFDDEFMRFLHYRNFYDAYEWQWKDGTSRWDLLDVVRLTRALKPDGIKWPFASDGRPTNRLEFLTSVNKLGHDKAHDALSDVHATIAVAQLIRERQPELFQYLFETRKKDKVRAVVDSGKPFMYTSGRYPGEFFHTTAAVLLGRHSQQDYALVYDLRVDPAPFLKMSTEELIEAWKYSKDPEHVRLPVKTLKYNRCPAVVTGIVKDADTLERLGLSREGITDHWRQVSAAPDFVKRLFAAVQKMDAERERAQVAMVDNSLTVDERLYDGFVEAGDAATMRAVRLAKPEELSELKVEFKDARLKSLLPLYKARNYPAALTAEERASWEAFVQQKLLTGGPESRMATYFDRVQTLLGENLSGEQQYLLEELRLYGESIMPDDAIG
jgi:exodeoxyribonuclease-1